MSGEWSSTGNRQHRPIP